ncbi:glucosyltransferase domain-containing protein [Halomonas dongshanensis]|uniref:Glucosyltransferase domain-containing protein n=1 Tax=Halomonas dongshanensis TaxID=2890835 RepID=A0ABT2EBT5_9GAMM|nr:glucosyltransferase domain-containing protein [Halomonas dongshanensis]MCS2609041.1 glucosyltransferase domain-containing protein [Halomonas dongshanensis]
MKVKLEYYFLLSCALFSMPAVMLGVYYRDDYWRVVTGGNFWGWAGRQGADQLAHLLSLSRYHVDSYPLGLILAIVTMAGSLIYISKKSSEEDSYASLALPLLFINPFFIQNLAYRFDAPQMIIALALAIFAYYKVQGGLLKSFASVLLVFLSLIIYQPCVNIFLGLMAVNYCFKIKKSDTEKDSLVLSELFVFLLGYVSYLFFQKFVIGNIPRSETIAFSEIHISLYYVSKYLYESVSSLFVGYAAYLLFLFLLVSFFCVFSFLKTSFFKNIVKEKRVFSLFVFLSVPLLLFFASTGPSFILAEGVTDIRVLVGFSSVVFFLAVAVLKKMPEKYAFFIVLIPVYCFIVFSFQFFNAVKAQRLFEENIVSNISYDLSQYVDEEVEIYMSGVFPIAPIANVIASRSPLIMRMLSPMEGWISGPALKSYGNNVAISWTNLSEDKVLEVCNGLMDEVLNKKQYAIYQREEIMIVHAKGAGDIC